MHVAYTTDLRVQSAKYNVHKDSYYRLAKCKSVAAQSIITGAQMLEAYEAVNIRMSPILDTCSLLFSSLGNLRF